jgi:hypothetical protein
VAVLQKLSVTGLLLTRRWPAADPLFLPAAHLLPQTYLVPGEVLPAELAVPGGALSLPGAASSAPPTSRSLRGPVLVAVAPARTSDAGAGAGAGGLTGPTPPTTPGTVSFGVVPSVPAIPALPATREGAVSGKPAPAAYIMPCLQEALDMQVGDKDPAIATAAAV